LRREDGWLIALGFVTILSSISLVGCGKKEVPEEPAQAQVSMPNTGSAMSGVSPDARPGPKGDQSGGTGY
jgi:hypothetical protein